MFGPDLSRLILLFRSLVGSREPKAAEVGINCRPNRWVFFLSYTRKRPFSRSPKNNFDTNIFVISFHFMEGKGGFAIISIRIPRTPHSNKKGSRRRAHFRRLEARNNFADAQLLLALKPSFSIIQIFK